MNDMTPVDPVMVAGWPAPHVYPACCSKRLQA